MKRNLLFVGLLSAFISTSGTVFAQGMSVNITGAAADHSAMLDVGSTTKGMLMPRMDSAQRATISSPATGLLVYQTDGLTPGFYFYNGSAWTPLSGISGSTATPQMQKSIFTSSGTFTTPPGITSATVFKVTITGAGGGFADCIFPLNCATTGGAGATVIKWISGLSPSTGYTITIGAGGTSGTTATATAGSSSSVLMGSTYTAHGGGIGAPGSASGGDINIAGGPGGNVNTNIAGASIWGALSYGSGGLTGVPGANGIVVIEWIQ